MPERSVLPAIARATALLLSTVSTAYAFDDAKYPNLKGQWDRVDPRGGFDQTRPTGRGQQAPLTPEYKVIFEENLADQAKGGQGTTADHARCIASGMPLMMVAFRPLEFVVTPDTTYILIADYDPFRRVFTDGRDWPKKHEPTYQGYSIGKWVDEDGDGRYDVLEVETRNFKGPRIYDVSGLPLHYDNESIFKERIYLDRADPNLLHDEITVIDNALTRPWTADKKYTRNADPQAEWFEAICPEYNAQVFIGKEHFYLSADGFLMPAKPGQEPPDLRYFNQPRR
jgi:hypothetical protein